MNKKKKVMLALGGIAVVTVSALAGYKIGHDKGCLKVMNEFGKTIPDFIEKVSICASHATVDTIDTLDPQALGYIFDKMTAKEFYAEVLKATFNDPNVINLSEIGKGMANVKKW